MIGSVAEKILASPLSVNSSKDSRAAALRGRGVPTDQQLISGHTTSPGVDFPDAAMPKKDCFTVHQLPAGGSERTGDAMQT